jgi:hypothetical protein
LILCESTVGEGHSEDESKSESIELHDATRQPGTGKQAGAQAILMAIYEIVIMSVLER